MYCTENLEKIPFFQGLRNENSIENVLDSLTGVISRKFIIRYVESLLKSNTSFALMIADIDNFKKINDSHGHNVGDDCLIQFASNLASYIGDDGLVGRFGGDEFLIVLRGDVSYDRVHDYLIEMGNSGMVVRREYQLASGAEYLTACIGSASYPDDATDYDELFLKADKALYRGKTKGRNCFIVYVDKKHRDIEIEKITKEPMSQLFKKISTIFDSGESLSIRAEDALDYAVKHLGASGAYFIDKNKNLLVSNSDAELISCDFEGLHLSSILNENRLFFTNDLDYLKTKSEILYNLCIHNGIQSILLSDITMNKNHMGYVIITENKIKRIWMEPDMTLIIYLSTILGYNILMDELKKEA